MYKHTLYHTNTHKQTRKHTCMHSRKRNCCSRILSHTHSLSLSLAYTCNTQTHTYTHIHSTPRNRQNPVDSAARATFCSCRRESTPPPAACFYLHCATWHGPQRNLRVEDTCEMSVVIRVLFEGVLVVVSRNKNSHTVTTETKIRIFSCRGIDSF